MTIEEMSPKRPWIGTCFSRSPLTGRFAVMLREKEDTELKPVITEGDTTYIYVKVFFPHGF